MQLTPAPTLPYVTNDPTLTAPWRRITRLPKIPAWLISFLLLATFQATAITVNKYLVSYPNFLQPFGHWFNVMPMAILITIAIKRTGWLRSLIAFPALAALLFILTRIEALNIDVDNPMRTQNIFNLGRAVSLFVAALLWNFSFSRRGLAAFVEALFIASLIPLLSLIADDARIVAFISHPWPRSWPIPWSIESTAEPYAIIALFWLLIRCLTTAPQRIPSLRKDLALLLSTFAVSVGITTYYLNGQTALIARLFPYNPYLQNQNFYWQYLKTQYITDEQTISALEKANWSLSPITALSRLEFRGLKSPESRYKDWRLDALFTVSAEGYHECLARILVGQPSLFATICLADEVLAAKHYPAIPIVLRCALFNNDQPCIDILMKLKFPQAGWACLENSPYLVRKDLDTNSLDMTREYSSASYDLYALFNLPPGPNGKLACRRLLLNLAGGRHAPFPDDISDQADQLVWQFARCVDAEDRAFTRYIMSTPTPHDIFADLPKTEEPSQYFALHLINRLTLAKLLGFHPPTGDFQSLAELTQQVDRYVTELAAYSPPPSTAPAATR